MNGIWGNIATYLSEALQDIFPLQHPAAVFLAVAVIIVVVPLVCQRLRIPYIIGLIVAGVVLGPHAVGVLAPGSSFEFFGDIGILYLMFLAGVEIDRFNLQNNYRNGVLLGVLTFLLPMLIGVPLVHYVFSLSWGSSMLIGVMLSAHTLLTYPAVTRFGLSNTRPAVVSVCATIVAVLAALIVLAEIVQIRRDGGFSLLQGVILVGKLVGYVVVLYWIITRLTRFFFRRYADGVVQFVYVLAIILGCSTLARELGLEAILGAFFAGLALNRFIPFRSVLLRRLDFVGNAIFIPYFLIGVGMLIDVRAIFSTWTVAWMALAFTSAALVGKWLAAWLTQRLLGYDGCQRRLMFGLTAGKAAATIAAAMIGFRYGLLTDDEVTAAVGMILLCCIVASVVTQRAVVQMRMRLTDDDMRERGNSDGRVRMPRQLVAVGNPVTAEGLVKLAAMIRPEDEKEEPDSEMVLLSVRSSSDAMHGSVVKRSLHSAHEAASVMDLRAREVLRYDLNLSAGILNTMKENGCNQLILGLHRPVTAIDSFFGVMEEELVRNSHTMLVMSRCFVPLNTLRRIVVFVPANAHYETGFAQWVVAVGSLAIQLGSDVEFFSVPDTMPMIQRVLDDNRLQFNREFQPMKSWDDFLILSSRISDEDLMVSILARRGSISFGPEVEALPGFLNKYFRRYNLLVIYPEQFGSSPSVSAATDILSVQ